MSTTKRGPMRPAMLFPAPAFVPFRPEHAGELVIMWRASFEQGVGITDPHSLADQQDYLMNQVVPHTTVRVALLDGKIVGFAAASHEHLDQLYVHTEYQGQGIGTRLLNWAKAQSNGTLWLYTFSRNHRACTFYERSGFTVAARGFEPTWQLEDIKYVWSSS